MPKTHNKSEIEAALKKYDRLLLTMNSDSIATLYAIDGDLGNVAHGRDSIRKFLSSFKNIRMLSQSSTSDLITMYSDSAIQEGSYEQVDIINDRDTVSVAGDYVVMWIWHHEEGWLIKKMETTPLPNDFAKIITGMPVMSLPIRFPEWDNGQVIPDISSKETRAFVNKFDRDNMILLRGRILPEHSMILLVGTMANDYLTPVLITLDLSGKLISQTPLLSNYLFSPGLYSITEEECIIAPDMNVFESYQVRADSTENKRGTEGAYRIVKRGLITDGGSYKLLSRDSSEVKNGPSL